MPKKKQSSKRVASQGNQEDAISDDEIDKFHQENEEKIMLARDRLTSRKQRKTGEDGRPKEFMPIEVASSDEDDGDDDNDSEDDEDIDMRSDIVDENEENYLPSASAWGKKRAAFYHADYVDQDYGGFSGSDADMAEEEEEEAKRIQKETASSLRAEDFMLDEIIPETEDSEILEKSEKSKIDTEKISVNLKEISKDEKIRLLIQQSPEFLPLAEEFQLVEQRIAKIYPMIENLKKMPESATHPGLRHLRAKFEINTNYLLNLGFYFLLQAKREPTGSHPVLDRIMQWKKMAEKINAQCAPFEEKLLEFIRSGREIPGILKNLKKKKIAEILKKGELESDEENLEENLEEKRGITYQMAKNKGIVRAKKKELRNPRVKHRMKFRKALIRRRSQIPDVRRELKKYDGESRGIKTNLIRSTKLK